MAVIVFGIFGFAKSSVATGGCCVYYDSSVDPVNLDCILYPIVKTTLIVESPKNIFCDEKLETDGRPYFLLSDAIDEKYYIDNTKYAYYKDKTNVLGAYKLNDIISSCPVLSGTTFVETDPSNYVCSVNMSLSEGQINQVFLNKLHENVFLKFTQYADSEILRNLDGNCCVPAKDYEALCHPPSFDELTFNSLTYNSFFSGYSDYFLRGGKDGMSGYIQSKFVYCSKTDPEKWDVYPYRCDDQTQGVGGPGLSVGVKDTINGVCSQRKPNNISFCICKKDKSQCNETSYDTLPQCRSALSGSESLKDCVELNKGLFQTAGCESLVINTRVLPNVPQGTTNSDMISGLSSEIKALNKLNVNNVQSLLGNFIKLLLGVLGTLALVMIMYGGFLFMTANGNADNKKKAVGIFVWSTLGIVIIFSSYAVVNFVLDILK